MTRWTSWSKNRDDPLDELGEEPPTICWTMIEESADDPLDELIEEPATIRQTS